MSFTPDQVSYFRQVFTQFCDEDVGGVTRTNFIPAVQLSVEDGNVAGPTPSPEYLDNEFQRVANEEGIIQWQQFFQVLIHLNLRQSASPAPQPQEPIRQQNHEDSQRARVQFSSDIPPMDDDEPPPPSYDELQPPDSDVRANTIGRQLLRSVGGFFGLTEASQRGGAGDIGWQEYAERNIEENPGIFTTVSRRGSLRNRVVQRPPSYPAVVAGHSFDLNEFGDDSDEDEGGFTSAPPPQYGDVIENPSGVGMQPLQQQQYPEPTHPGSAVAPPPRSAGGRVEDLIHNQREAWDYYLKYTKAEKKLRQRRHQTDAYDFFGSAEGEAGGPHRERSGSVRRERLHSLDQAQGVVRRPKKKKRTKLQRQSTLIRTEVESLPTFWPIFIVLISVAQVVAVVVLLPIYGLAPIKISPIEETNSYASLLTMDGMDNITYFRSTNLWIGLTPLNLIRFGAKFSPCMRTDFRIRQTITATINDAISEGYGCCQNQQWVGNTVFTGCGAATTLERTNATFFEAGTRCMSNNSMTSPAGANFHPCCISVTGHCAVMHPQECEDRGGFFHEETDSCDNVNCFRDICGFNEVLVGEESDNAGNPIPLSPMAQQFWRYFTSTYLHLGVIHIIIIIPIQLYVGIKIERTIGWLRIWIIYTISGVGGNLVSAIFDAYGVNAGASGAVFGLLGVLYVELFQFWQIVDRAWLELVKLTAFVIFLLALGTLPYVDNMAHIGGILFGVPAAIIFVPYITFGKWDAARKRILLVICIPLLLILFLVGFLTFYLIATADFCGFCHYINCVPYSPGLCPEEFANPNPANFSL